MADVQNNRYQAIGVYDTHRRGIFIHADQLSPGPYRPGDRFAVRKGKQEPFTIKIVKNSQGPFIFDRNGLFIARTRRIDILLGGIFDAYAIFFDSKHDDLMIIRSLERLGQRI
jgi:hypothetical protein